MNLGLDYIDSLVEEDEVDHFFGTNFCTLDTCGESPLIKAKKVVLKNDYVRQFIDVYHV